MELQNLIEDLEEIIENASKVPLSNKCMIDRDEVWEVIQEFRLSFPEEIKQAQYIKKERERILSDAKQEAQKIIEDGKQEVAMMVNETEILKIAQSRADDILKDADMKAVEIRHAAEEEGKDIIAEATDVAENYKKDAKNFANDLLSKVEGQTAVICECAFEAYQKMGESYKEMNNAYQKSNDLLSKISASKSLIMGTPQQDE